MNMENWAVNPTDIIVWVVCAGFVLGALIKSWPFVRKFVDSVDLIVKLGDKLDAIGRRFDKQDVLLSDVRRMVTENHHTNSDPTIPDRISDLHKAIEDSEVKAQLRWNEHLEYSATVVERVSALEKRLRVMAPRPDDH